MNLFMPVYYRLEKEVVSLTNSIMFNDEQMKVYSLAIGDIIIRCAVEAEAISKELYIRTGGNPEPVDPNTGRKRDLYFDTECIQRLVDRWSIDKKRLTITHPNMYFSAEKSILFPLRNANKRGKSSSPWERAYQAVKHNRAQNIHLAAVENMMNALGALYILNLYYADEKFWFETPMEQRRQYTASSEIFTPALCDTTKVSINMNTDYAGIQALSDPSLEKSIFILKHTDKAYQDMQKSMCKLKIRADMKLKRSYNLDNISQALTADYAELLKKDAWVMREAVSGLASQEVILNKNSEVYSMFFV